MSDLEGENFIRQFILDGAMNGGLGVAAASLPKHISLGMPYYVKDFDAYLKFAEDYAKTLKPVTAKITGMKSNPMGPTGAFLFTFDCDTDLEAIRKNTREALRSELDLEVPETDGVTGTRNITLGFGKATAEEYKAYVDGTNPADYVGHEVLFNELGVFYYDEEKIAANNFCVVKRIKL